MSRINIVALIVGRRGSGKTIYTKRMIKKYLENKKVLVCDTLDHPSYKGVERIKPIDIPNMENGDFCRVFGGETDRILNACNKFSNGLLVFEDATKYVGKNLTKEVKQFIYDSKQKNVDILFLFHGFTSCPPDLFRACDMLVMFKTGDSPDIRKNDLGGLFNEVKLAYEKMLAKGGNDRFTPEIVQIY